MYIIFHHTLFLQLSLCPSLISAVLLHVFLHLLLLLFVGHGGSCRPLAPFRLLLLCCILHLHLLATPNKMPSMPEPSSRFLFLFLHNFFFNQLFRFFALVRNRRIVDFLKFRLWRWRVQRPIALVTVLVRVEPFSIDLDFFDVTIHIGYIPQLEFGILALDGWPNRIDQHKKNQNPAQYGHHCEATHDTRCP